MKFFARSLPGWWLLLAAAQVYAHGPEPMPLTNVPIPPVPGLLDGADPIVVNPQKAIALGKALFWDVNVGSDGMACASCHFHAGADRRVKNQLNPGAKSPLATGQTFEPLPSGGGGPNYSLRLADFPTYRFNDPFNKLSGVSFATDDVISSSGTFSGQFTGASRFSGAEDACARAADPVFHVGSTGTRRVEPRNTPTVINAVFNHRNFWDGRANNIFNGSSPWGDRDPNAGVWVKVNARTVVKQRLHLENSSLASQAVAPPLSDTEMSCQQRSWPAIGRKLLLRQPLQYQKVHHEDSVLGSLSLSTPGNLQPGLNTTYRTLITQAFNPKYWSYSGTGPFGAPPGQAPYNQMEANFAMFFGIALQMYEGTLVSDQAPIDLTERNSFNKRPTWQGLGYDAAKIARLTDGFNSFINKHCNLCHAGPLMTLAAIQTNSMLVTPTPGKTFGPSHAQIPYGPNALGNNGGAAAAGISQYVNVVTREEMNGTYKLVDFGFANTGVANPIDDPGVGGVDDFNQPLSFADQYVQYLLGNNAGIFDPGVNTSRACDFIQPIAYNQNNPLDTFTFNASDGLEPDGTREGSLRNQNCISPNVFPKTDAAYIPTVAAAQAALASQPQKLAVAKQAVFKIPGLRNVELTGPYMHNGSMATLDQVLEFYGRSGNVDNSDLHFLLVSNSMDVGSMTPQQRANLIEFLGTFTDDRVRYEKAPFDHPELPVFQGHPGDHQSVTAGNALHPALATDDILLVPAVGANGSTQPLQRFDTFLAP